MFSGLTNQVSSWMGAAKGDTEEQVPTPPGEVDVAFPVDGGDKKQSPTKGGTRLEMFTNVKSQMTGWLGNASIPSIPGLRKAGDGSATDGEVTADATDTNAITEDTAAPLKDEDDNSSATGGADSGPGSPAGTPTDEQGGQVGAGVTTKAVAGAKSFGSFLYSAVNKAGAKVSEASAKIKKTVEENSLLGEFNKEQDAFIKGQAGKTDAAVPPWVGCPNEEALKEECLSLSSDRRNFVRAPPAGVDFVFDYDVSYPIAIAIMAEDPSVEKMRFDLVPKIITEENFWRNYFYRVSLICQANELNALGEGGYPTERTTSVDEFQASETDITMAPKQSSTSESEFVSDTFRATQQDIEEVREGMKRLGMDKENRKEEDWERELEEELQDYEVVTDGANNGNGSSSNTGDNWEKDVDDLLGDETDLK